METDPRFGAARYYDLQEVKLGDVSFYEAHIPSPDARILELGCGTGRVMVPLAGCCGYIYGIDHSAEMLAVCADKLKAAGVPSSKARTGVADITDFDLGERFDLITAPFRVVQNLETDAQFDGLFRCIRKHLAPGGRCILNVFKPLADRQTLLTTWCKPGERLGQEIQVDGGRITKHDAHRRLDPQTMVLYPELIYRFWQGDTMVDEQVLKIAMKCFWPDEFVDLITSHGFTVIDKWGGYAGEVYGEGAELVVEFGAG